MKKDFTKLHSFKMNSTKIFLFLNNDYNYDAIIQAIADANKCFFVNNPNGTVKTFLYNTLLITIRLSGEIAIAVISSSIAAFLIMSSKIALLRLLAETRGFRQSGKMPKSETLPKLY